MPPKDGKPSTPDWSEAGSMGSTTDCDSSSDNAKCVPAAEISILCELVGARHLAVHDEDADIDTQTMRPYCVVKFGDKILHRTKSAAGGGCDPIWTVSTKSLFLLKVSPLDLSRGILNFIVYAKKEKSLRASLLVQNESTFLGQLNLDANAILSNCNQERFEVNLEDEMGEESAFLGSLALRFRLATPSDHRILPLLQSRLNKHSVSEELIHQLWHDKNKKEPPRKMAQLITETSESEVAQSSFLNAMSNVFSASVRDVQGTKMLRIKPGPDPTNPKETTFLNPQQIRVETRNPSKNWVEAGSGSLGKLYVEILACHDLPNVDVGEAVGNVTDSFVSVVYEDTCAMTDVIDDELSPHWLPWTQRAFCFGMMHPASILYLGVFDYDLGSDHEPIGRVAVNVSNLQRNTMYTLKYNLYPSSDITDRTANGSITIRLRVECPDEKAAILAALKPRPKIHVNCQQKKSFKVMRYTCFGQFDNEEKFELTVVRSYINEIFAYKSALSYAVADTVGSLMFWRGQVQFCGFFMPLHSFVFFTMATNLVERPQLIVPFTLIGVGWIMLACLEVRRQHPSPWHRCPSFWHFLTLLREGKSNAPILSIKEFEGDKAAQGYEQEWGKRLEEDRKVAEKRAALQQEIDAIGDDTISTKLSNAGPIPLELLNRLGRYQRIIGNICKKFRLCKIIVTWEESVVSFWITAVFLTSGLFALLLPWGFILTWTSRFLVWGLFGPHMMVVDLTLRANKNKDGKLRSVMKNFDVQSKMARLRREEAVKVKDIKELAFGKLSIQVPSFNLARHYDRPLPESSARVCRQAPKRLGNRRVSVVNIEKPAAPWIPGQQLHGDMIPRPGSQNPGQKGEEKEKEKIAMYQELVNQIRKSSGVLTIDQLKLKKMGMDLNTPMSFGYEVIPLEGEGENHQDEPCCSSLNNNERKSSTRLSVQLTADNAFSTSNSFEQLLLEKDGENIYEVDSDYPAGNSDEEGMEIVGLGRYSTLAEEAEMYEHDLMTMPSTDSLLQDNESRLSQMFKSSDKIEVVFYRPLSIEKDLDDTD